MHNVRYKIKYSPNRSLFKKSLIFLIFVSPRLKHEVCEIRNHPNPHVYFLIFFFPMQYCVGFQPPNLDEYFFPGGVSA